MPSTTSFFNKTLFFKTIKRFWPLWALYLLFWIFLLPVGIKNSLHSLMDNDINGDMISLTVNAGIAAIFIVSCIAAMLIHSWMYSAKNAGAFSALPIKREGILISLSLAGIAPMLAVHLISCIAAFIIGVNIGCSSVFITMLECFAILSLLAVLFFGIATFCAVLTGHGLVLPVLYVILNFTSVVVELVVSSIAQTVVFGADVANYYFEFLSPPVFLYENLNCSSIKTILLICLVYAAVGVLLFFAGLLIFRKRKMEAASDVVAVPVLKPVFKYCFCFGCALVIGTVINFLFFDAFRTDNSQSALFISISMLIGGTLGYFAAEMLLKKSFRVFKKAWKGFLIAAAVIILFNVTLEYDLTGFERRTPGTADVSSLTVEINGQPTVFDEGEDIDSIIGIHKLIIQGKKEYEAVYTDSYDYSYYNIMFSYKLKNGNYLTRYYTIADISLENGHNPVCELYNAVNTPSGILSRISRFNAEGILYGSVSGYYVTPEGNSEDFDYYLSAEASKELFREGILPDALNGRIGTLDYTDMNSFVSENTYDYYIVIDFGITAENGYYYSYQFYPDMGSESTIAFLTKSIPEFIPIAQPQTR